MKKVSVALAFAAITAFAQPSFAQAVPTTTAGVIAACAGSGNCAAIVQAFLAAPGRTVTTGMIANLAVGLANVQGITAADRASALNSVAAASPDPSQAAQVATLADTVASGQGGFNTASIGTGASTE